MTIQVGDNELSFYDSIKTLPNVRRFLSNEYQVWSSEVGNNISKAQENITSAFAYLTAGNIKDGLLYLQNADIGLEALKQDEDFGLKELACYLKSINGNIVDVTKENIDEVSNKLNDLGIEIGQVEETLELIKKKYLAN